MVRRRIDRKSGRDLVLVKNKLSIIFLECRDVALLRLPTLGRKRTHQIKSSQIIVFSELLLEKTTSN